MVQFIILIRSILPSATVPGKMHLLEDHTEEELISAQACVEFGMMGEQCACRVCSCPVQWLVKNILLHKIRIAPQNHCCDANKCASYM